MAHPVVVAVWDASGTAWPTNSSDFEGGIGSDVRAQITLRPTASNLLASVKKGSARLQPNAKIAIAAVIRRPPILLEHRRYSAVIEPAEIVLATGHTLITLPRYILKVPSGIWNNVRFTHFEAVSPWTWPLCAAAEATMAAARPPCSVCGHPSQDIDRCLCYAHLMLDTPLQSV